MLQPRYDPKFLLRQGVKFLQSGNLVAAADIFKRILNVNPKNPDALHLLGLVNNMQGRYVEGLRLIGKAIKSNPKIGDYHRNLG